MEFAGAFRRPSELSLSGNVAENWRKFRAEFDIFLVAAGLDKTGATRQAMCFLNVVGPGALDVYHTFEWEEEDDAKKLDKIKEKFDAYCNPQKNETYERHVFKSRIQGPSETVDQFVTELRVKAASCNFGTLTDSMIRDQVVAGIRSNQVRERLLREPDLTLQKTIRFCRSFEASSHHMQNLTLDEKEAHSVTVKSGKGRGKKKFTKTDSKQAGEASTAVRCSDCGYTTHRSGQCPAIGKICKKCGNKGHFASVCKGGARPKFNVKGKAKNVHTVTDEQQIDDDQEEDLDDMFYINCITETANTVSLEKVRWNASVRINSTNVSLKIDTGSDINSLPKSLYDQISEQPLMSSKARLIGYFGQKQRPCGKAILEVEYKNKLYSVEFQVVDAQVVPVLGLTTSTELGLIKRLYTLNIEKSADGKPEAILDEFKDVFKGLGCLDYEYDIKVDETISPVIHAPRRVAFALRDQLKAQLQKMENEGVIKHVTGASKWVNSMVVIPKSNGSLRVCIDPRDLNRAILREQYPMKTVEEVAGQLSSANVFSVLDAGQAYYQVKLSDASSDLLCFNTPFGRYKFCRMPFGIKSAPEVYQRIASQIFDNLDGVDVIMDDVLVWGRNMEEHNMRLRAALQRVRESHLTLNRDKCKIGVRQVRYVGHILTNKGLQIDNTKIQAINEMDSPTDKKELSRFMGMVNYVGKFIPNLSARSAPLRELLNKDVAWHWDEQHEKCISDLKSALTHAPVLAYFNPDLPVSLQVDASSHGLGACVIQEGRPVAYASRSLNKAEKNYAQLEKEMLAIAWGCSRLHDYVYGSHHVTVFTDHKPLESLYQKSLASAPPRCQRMMLRTQRYDIQVVYKPGKELFIADTLSRAPVSEPDSKEDEYEVHVVDSMPISDDKLKHFMEETASDPGLQKLIQYVMAGWPDTKQEVDTDCQPYWTYRDEISICDGLLLKNNRLVVPSRLRKEMLRQVHQSHLGIEKCRQRARDLLFWPGMNGEISEMVSNCPTCLQNRPAQQKEPLLQHEMPSRPWQKLATDLFELDGQAYILLVDYYSKYTEYTNLQNTKSETVVQWLKEQFARHGIPDVLVSDNGPQYISTDFTAFTKSYGFRHDTSSPTYPQSNGMAERTVQTLKNILKKVAQTGQDPHLAVLEWRNTPIGNIGTPTQLLMGRRTKTTLPSAPVLLKPQKLPENTTERLLEKHENQAQYYNRSTKPLPLLKPGEVVRMRTQDGWTPAQVKCHAGKPRSYVVKKHGRDYRRNRRDLMRTKESVLPVPPDIEAVPEPTVLMNQASQQTQQTPVEAHPQSHHKTVDITNPPDITPVSRVSGRAIRKPLRFRSPE